MVVSIDLNDVAPGKLIFYVTKDNRPIGAIMCTREEYTEKHQKILQLQKEGVTCGSCKFYHETNLVHVCIASGKKSGHTACNKNDEICILYRNDNNAN